MVWLGLKRLSNVSPFQWLSGAPVTYTNWLPDGPANTTDDCVGFNYLGYMVNYDCCVVMHPVVCYTKQK